MSYKRINSCRLCGSTALTDVLSLGEQFLASSFVPTNEGNPMAANRFPLTWALCDRAKNPDGCGLLQLRETVDRDLMYREYFYRSATNPMMRDALKEIADAVQTRVTLSPGDAILDIGCNDGTMLTFFPATARRFGIDPAKNIPALPGIDPEIRIRTDYFSKSVAREMISRPAPDIARAWRHATSETGLAGEGNVPSTSGNIGSGTFKAITSIAMFYDLDDPHAFVRDVKSVLHPEGVWCIQLSYLRDVIQNMNFFDICHEHLLYYSLGTLKTLLARHGLDIVDASTNPVNGGSLRVFVRHAGQGYEASPAVQRILEEEYRMGLDRPETFQAFGQKITDLKNSIVGYLQKEKERGGTVVGLGASTKGNVLLQYFGIGKDLVPYLCDRNPEKTGLRTLGTDIEVISEERMRAMHPSCLLVLIWFFRDELLRREREYLDTGGTMLFPMPHPSLVTKDGETPLSA